MKLYVVATPIGNLDDLSPRAISTLKTVDLIAAEDTRHSQTLLRQFGIQTPTIAYHDHNEEAASQELVERMRSGTTIALISDAGTPLISDPGYRLVKRARAAGLEVIPIPGASALITALSVSGLPTDRFLFLGFLPAKQQARRKMLESLQRESATLVFYESRHRITDVLQDMQDVLGADREATLARELTKRFEQIRQGTLQSLSAGLADHSIVEKGEFVVMIEGARSVAETFEHEPLMRALLAELPPKKAASIASQLTGESKKVFYNIALALKQDKNEESH